MCFYPINSCMHNAGSICYNYKKRKKPCSIKYSFTHHKILKRMQRFKRESSHKNINTIKNILAHMRYFSLTEKRQQSQKNRLQSFKSKIQVSFRGFLTQKFYLVIQIFLPFLIILFTATISISWFSCRIFVF